MAPFLTSLKARERESAIKSTKIDERWECSKLRAEQMNGYTGGRIGDTSDHRLFRRPLSGKISYDLSCKVKATIKKEKKRVPTSWGFGGEGYHVITCSNKSLALSSLEPP